MIQLDENMEKIRERLQKRVSVINANMPFTMLCNCGEFRRGVGHLTDIRVHVF